MFRSYDHHQAEKYIATLGLRHDFLLGWFLALNMEVTRCSETSVRIRTTRRYIPEDGNI
jgi:hypothetical protein